MNLSENEKFIKIATDRRGFTPFILARKIANFRVTSKSDLAILLFLPDFRCCRE